KQISSFPGDYGRGKVISSSFLNPNESVTMRVKVSQSTKDERTASTSIIDSNSKSTQQDFSKSLSKAASTQTDNSTDWTGYLNASAGYNSGGGSSTTNNSEGGSTKNSIFPSFNVNVDGGLTYA